jgi:outer membrane receptor protein involved in Fe transport
MISRCSAHRYFLALASLACLTAAPLAAPAAGTGSGTTVSGRILDIQGGLTVPNATVELNRGGTTVATAKTDANGRFRIPNVPPGTYAVLIRARGYNDSRVSPDLLVSTDVAEVSFQTAITRATTGLKTIGYVSTQRQALQTTATMSTHVDTSIIQGQNFQRLGDVLTTVPGVITSTSSSVGDDMTLSIRGFDPTETATLLDGHPIGPIGAFGNGYNYNVSPFWGLSSVDVIFGSGATGLYGATTIAGAVNFLTINPTQGTHFTIEQGAGSFNKYMTGLMGTGTIGKLGYAVAWGSQGTTGYFDNNVITQNALLQTSVVHPGSGSSPPPPDLTNANKYNLVNTYNVSGNYTQRNFVGKLVYTFSPKTALQFTSYSAQDWSNSTGQGDNDYETFPYVLYGARQTLASIQSSPGKLNTILVNGQPRSCHDSIAVLTNGAPGFTCMTPVEYALNFYGPFGGSIDRWRSLGNSDNDARLTQQLGTGTITAEGFVDSYNYNEQKGPGAYTYGYGPGPNYLNLYLNRGYLLQDEYSWSKNDFAFGYSWLHQSNTNGQFPFTLPNGTTYNVFGNNPPLYLATSSYFVRDAWTPNNEFSAFGSIWVQRSLDTSSTHVGPRLSLVYRPDPSDVFRVTGGRSYSEPDPSLLAFAPPVYGAPSSINCPPALTGTGAITSIASIADPNLIPETAEDLEAAYGHRFNATTNIQADVYQAWESEALLGGNVPILSVPQIKVPQDYITKALDRLESCPGLHPTINNLGFSTTYNAASARYRGIVLSSNVGITRNFSWNGSFTVQSAAYVGVPTDILISNTNLIDGAQMYGIPLRQGTTGVSYQNSGGLAAQFDANYFGGNNSWNRNPFWFANFGISKTSGPVTVGLGVYNVFNSVAQQYGLIGYGVYIPQNFYGLQAQGGATSGLQQSNEQFGLPFRSIFFWVRVST